MDKTSKILGSLLAVAILVIILMRSCGGGALPCPETVVVAVDTVRNEVTIDTIRIVNTDTVYRNIYVKVPIPYRDTVYLSNTATAAFVDNFDDILSESPWIYKDSISDDTISIAYVIKTYGAIKSIDIKYRPLADYYIEKRSILETEITKKKKNFGLYAGLNVGGNKAGLTHAAPAIEFTTEKVTYNIEYDLVDRALTGGVKLRIRLKRKQ